MTAVTEAYLRRLLAHQGTAPEAAQATALRRIIRAGIDAGLSTSEVASGAFLGILHNLTFDEAGLGQVRSAAAVVAAATTTYGGQIRAAIDGVLAAAAKFAEENGGDPPTALAAAAAGIIDGLGVDSDLF